MFLFFPSVAVYAPISANTVNVVTFPIMHFIKDAFWRNRVITEIFMESIFDGCRRLCFYKPNGFVLKIIAACYSVQRGGTMLHSALVRMRFE